MKNRGFAEWREFLKEDYFRVTGEKCQHFFCPILLRDEDVPLCQGHIVNQAFNIEKENTILQRKDVDNFYGRFEVGFIDSDVLKKLRIGEIQLLDLIEDSQQFRRFNPQFFHKSEPLKFAFVTKNRPANFWTYRSNIKNKGIDFGFIMPDETMLRCRTLNVEQIYNRDVYDDIIPSLLKAAHLSAFYSLGYDYVFSEGGKYVAKILGDFFILYSAMKGQQLKDAAKEYFSDYANLIRPFEKLTIETEGTVNDGTAFFVCTPEKTHWAVIIIVKTKINSWAVLIPALDTNYHIETFNKIINSQTTQVLMFRNVKKTDSAWMAEERIFPLALDNEAKEHGLMISHRKLHRPQTFSPSLNAAP